MDGNVTMVWERQPGETARAFEAFRVYRDQGAQRSLRRTAEACYTGKSTVDHRQIERWSSKNRWVQRVAAFDAEQDRINQQQRQEAAENARKRALQGAHLVQRIAIKGLRQIDNRIGHAEENPPTNLLRYWREGVEMEFVSLGLPISVIKEQVEGPDPEELASQQRADSYHRARRVFGG